MYDEYILSTIELTSYEKYKSNYFLQTFENVIDKYIIKIIV